MAKIIELKNPATGMSKVGYSGYSWTTLFWGPFPALFRGDFLTFIGYFIIAGVLAGVTFGISLIFTNLAWGFFYNKIYTTKLLQQGFKINHSTHTKGKEIASELGADPKLVLLDEGNDFTQFQSMQQDLDNADFRLFLVDKYKISKNDVLNVYSLDKKSFNTLEDALLAAQELYSSSLLNQVISTGEVGGYSYESYGSGKVRVKTGLTKYTTFPDLESARQVLEKS